MIYPKEFATITFLYYMQTTSSLCPRSSTSITIQQLLQDSTNELISWSNLSGFRFAPIKTSLIQIDQRKKKETISVNIGSHSIKNKTQVKIFGTILHSKALWLPYILHIKKSYIPRINIIKILSLTFWGANTGTLLKIYKTLILS